MSLRPIEIEMIRSDIRKTNHKKHKAGYFESELFRTVDGRLFNTQTANDWLKQEQGKPVARMLFGSFWFEGELCILFADTNMGKSVLAVQIADCLSRGQSLQPFNSHMPMATTVLYVDFELSAQQFRARYSNHLNGSYSFHTNFYRAEFNPFAYNPDFNPNYEDYLNATLERAIMETGAQVLIIDNITYMSRGTERAKDALPLMQSLKAMKKKRKLSILVLAHTPKRTLHKPITVNDLQGSKMLINFADSAFAIGQSHTRPGLRYLKQIKQRNQQEEYGEENICLVSQQKELNFLRFTFEGHAHEQDHLRSPAATDREAQKQQILSLHSQGLSLRQIADQVGMHYTRVAQVVRQIKVEE